MRGEKIYEYDLDVTGMTDYGVSLDAILSGKEKIPPQGVRIDVAFEGRAIGRLGGGECGASTISGCAPTVVSTLIFALSLKLTTVAGLRCPPTAWPCRALLSRSPTYLRTSASARRPRNTSGSTRDRCGGLGP